MMVLDWLGSAVVLLRVALLFAIVFFIMPGLVIPYGKSENKGDNIAAIFIIGSVAVMAGIHLASVLHLMDSMALMIITLLSLSGIYLFRKRTLYSTDLTVLDKSIMFILDLSDSGMKMMGKVQFLVGAVMAEVARIFSHMIQLFMTTPVLFVLNIITFGIGFWVRAQHTLQHYYLGSSDSYLHLIWTKYIVNQGLYVDGIYPFGMHTALAYMAALFNTDAYYLYRYLGPVMGLLIILSIYHFVKAHFGRNLYAPWFACACYVFISAYPSQVWRQVSILPQEYAMVFMLPSLHFFIEYVNKNKKRDLVLFALGLCASLLIHFYSGFYLMLGAGFYALIHIKGLFQSRRLHRVIGYTLAGIFAGFSPMLLAYVMGLQFHVSFDFLTQSVKSAEKIVVSTNRLTIQELFATDLWLLIGVAIAAMGLIYGLIRIKKNGSEYVVISFMTILLYLFYRGETFQIPMPMLSDRTGNFLSVFVALTMGFCITSASNLAMKLIKSKSVDPIVAVLSFALLVYQFGIVIPTVVQLEYDQSAKVYEKILRTLPKGHVTLIAPQEQYQQIYGFGYHYQLWKLMNDQSDLTIKTVKMPTDHVFVFVEKIPLNSSRQVSLSDAKMAMPIVTGDLTAYYTQHRSIIESKAYYWAEAFRETHPEAVSVYYEDEVLKVYWISQDALAPLELKTSLPEEVFGQ